jgi:hypothetical protein
MHYYTDLQQLLKVLRFCEEEFKSKTNEISGSALFFKEIANSTEELIKLGYKLNKN